MISVCIPTYNGEQFIEEQINSILLQLEAEDEIIISDDGSSDRTLEILKSYNDPRIKIFHHQKSNSIKYKFAYTTNNIENALSHVNGDYIYLADQDDIWQYNKIKITQEFLKKYSLVCSNCTVINEKGETLALSYFKVNDSKEGIIKNILKNSYLGCCMAFRKDLIFKFLPFPKHPVPHDIWIGLLSEWYGEVLFVNKPLILYRRHGNNLSQSSEKSNNSLVYKFSYRLLIIKSFIKRILEF
jgi:glycosyltransferase involved in cell wall biosynthesis